MQSIEGNLTSKKLSWSNVLSLRVYVWEQSALSQGVIADLRSVETAGLLGQCVVIVPVTGIWPSRADSGREQDILLQIELLGWNLQT